jgi:hypothetical protein
MIISAQIIELHLLSAFEASLRAQKPQTLGYGLIIAEILKVSLGYMLIFGRILKPLEGAIISLTLAIAAQIIYYLKLHVEDLKQNVNWAYVKEWAKGSIANIYNVLGNQIAAFIFIMLFTYGGETARSNYGAAFQIANIITYSSFLAFALYPKLLAEKSSSDITTSIKTVLMFAIPMTAGALTLPDLYLTILNPEYQKCKTSVNGISYRLLRGDNIHTLQFRALRIRKTRRRGKNTIQRTCEKPALHSLLITLHSLSNNHTTNILYAYILYA